MAEIDEGTVRRIAELARLELDDDEVRRLAGELASILGHFEALDEAEAEGAGAGEGADVDGEAGDAVHRDLSPRLRTDVPSSDPLGRPPSETAPDWRDGYFVVPRLAAMQPDDGEGGG